MSQVMEAVSLAPPICFCVTLPGKLLQGALASARPPKGGFLEKELEEKRYQCADMRKFFHLIGMKVMITNKLSSLHT
jgi:hypothetical protein